MPAITMALPTPTPTPTPTRTRPSGLARMRNFGVIAHIDSGKTTVSERILFVTGRTHRMGNVDEGTTSLDYLPEERERGITITSAATTCEWDGFDLTLVDTPGHVDFTIEVERSLRVLDGAIGVFCAVAGVQAQTETVWRQAERYRVPRVAFVNKMDRPGADLDSAVAAMAKRLRVRPAVVSVPLGNGPQFRGVYDLISERTFGPDGPTELVPTAEETAKIAQARERLCEAAADMDDAIAESYLAGEPIATERLRVALRAGTLAGKITPVLCGAALKGVGIEPLLDAVCAFLPSPADLPPVDGVHPSTGAPEPRPAEPGAPLAVLAFKTISETTGDLTFLRVYGGTLEPGQPLWNPRTKRSERVGRLYRMHADRREAIEQAGPGAIVAVVGLRDAGTGDTLCDPEKPVRLPGTVVPAGVIAVAVSPPQAADRDRFGEGLRRLTREDPTLRVIANPDTSETLLEGMGELHLEIALNRLQRDFKIPVVAGAPQVAYRATIGRAVDVHIRHIKQTGGHGQFAVIRCKIEPIPASAEILFENELKGGAIPLQFVGPIEKGIREEAERGAGQKYPVVGLKVTLVDGKHHDVDSSDMAFRTAGHMAVRESLAQAGVVLLEPRMRLETTTPEASVGEVLGDLGTRRANVSGLDPQGPVSVVRADVPAAEMFAYATRLRSLTRGLGVFTLEPIGYAPVPASVAEKIREADAKAAKGK